MATDQFRGIYTIPVTPFDDSGAIDEPSLRRCLEFCVDAGAQGVVAPVNASEFFTLSDDERNLVVRTMVQVVDHAVPVVAGVTGVSPQHATRLARQAEEAGCDALVAMPPPGRQKSPDDISEYYQTMAQAVAIPIFLQNYGGPGGTAMSPELVARLVCEVEHLDYVKEETVPPGPMMTAILHLAGESCKGIMGGHGCAYLVEEHRRGSCGTMPACEVTDAVVHLWNLLDSGQEEEARSVFNRLLPLFNIERLYGTAAYKTILHRRGVIDSPYMRIPRRRGLDDYVLHELALALRRIDDLLTCRKYPLKV